MKNNDIIHIGHGSGGWLTRELIENIFVKHFNNPMLAGMHDASAVKTESLTLAFTTDSYVIDPIFFPGGDIGMLAVSGTINDLTASGSIPRYISCGFIIEEGLPVSDLDKIVTSMAAEAAKAKVFIVAGDTKVVKHGQCDKLFINTSGIGQLTSDRMHISSGQTIEPGDKVIVSGTLGDHAIAILAAREGLTLDNPILSDVAPLNLLVENIFDSPSSIRFMRDITRGGIATILSEICDKKDFGIEIEEKNIPVRRSVRAVCELYGFDPLYLANEGKMLLVAKPGIEDKIIQLFHKNTLGKDAKIVGEITSSHPGKAVLHTIVGGRRIIDMLSGEMLPRIC